MLALVKFVVPRIDAGYKEALKLQEKHQEGLAATLRDTTNNLARGTEALALLSQSTTQLAVAVGKIGELAQVHHTAVAVHQAKVDAGMKIS